VEQAIASSPEFAESTVFVKVDVDENKETAEACGIKSMPTFRCFRDMKAESTALHHILQGLLCV